MPPTQTTIIAKHSLGVLVAIAITTNLNALAIVVGLAMLQFLIVHTALLIGLAALLMSTISMLLGRLMEPCLGNKAEIIGGFILIGISCNILCSHIGGVMLTNLIG